MIENNVIALDRPFQFYIRRELLFTRLIIPGSPPISLSPRYIFVGCEGAVSLSVPARFGLQGTYLHQQCGRSGRDTRKGGVARHTLEAYSGTCRMRNPATRNKRLKVIKQRFHLKLTCRREIIR